MLSASLNSALNYIWTKGIYNGYAFSNKGLQDFAYSNLNYTFKQNWLALATTSKGRDIYLQSSSKCYINSTIGVSRDLWRKKLSIGVSTHTLFKKYRYVMTNTKAIEFYQEHKTQHLYGSVTLSLNTINR